MSSCLREHIAFDAGFVQTVSEAFLLLLKNQSSGSRLPLSCDRRSDIIDPRRYNWHADDAVLLFLSVSHLTGSTAAPTHCPLSSDKYQTWSDPVRS